MVDFETWLMDAMDLEEAPFLEDENEVVPHFIYFNQHIGTLVEEWGEEAMAKAVWGAYGSANWVGMFTEPFIPQHHLLLESVKTLYLEGFTLYCSEHYDNRGPEPPRPMNSPCYMLWDMCGLECMVREDSPMNGAVLETLRCILAMEHGACQHSALHGLGHIAGSMSEYTTPIIEEYLARDQIPAALEQYARSALTGCVL